MWAIARRLRGGHDSTPRPRVVSALVVTVLIGALAVLLVGIVGLALAGRRPPSEPIELAFPLRSGTYLVVNGGSQALILAPCQGRVVVAEDGAADMSPPQADRAHMVGNHVILECGGVWIVLGHLQQGSVAVHAGQITEPGQVLGLVGNSGNTGEPHLHIHAQWPGSTVAPLSGEPVRIRFGGRYLVRNDRVRADREGS